MMNIRKTGLALCAALALLTGGANAEEFTLLIYEPRQALDARTDLARADAYWGAYSAFAGALAQAGVLRGGAALSETQTQSVLKRGSVLRVRDTGGALAGARLGGFFLIDVANLQEATRWASQAPLASGGAVEVRPHRPNPSMQMAPGGGMPRTN